MTGSVEIRPATAERWPDIVTVFGPRGGDPSWCWCQLFLRAALPQPEEARDNRAALCQEVRQAAVPPGLLAYRDGRPVGWTRVTPVTELPGILGNRAIARVLPRDTAGIWWVACFAIQNRHRRSGVGRALLDA
ncbi:MAG: GNAT family N-acetyltransferase, partial [Clostridia bacterium]